MSEVRVLHHRMYWLGAMALMTDSLWQPDRGVRVHGLRLRSIAVCWSGAAGRRLQGRQADDVVGKSADFCLR